jgi:uncharacterized protein YjbJ (UPF0337 family)
MNWDVIQGKWQEFKGQFKQKWNKLTDDDWDRIAGKREELSGRLQKTYGYTKDEADRNIDDFTRNLKVREKERV